MANTYLPTISLVVIVEITLFFDATLRGIWRKTEKKSEK